MKRLFSLVAFLSILVTTISAQVHKGDWSINGFFAADQTWSELDFEDGREYDFEVSLGYLLSDHWMVGIEILDRVDFDALTPQVRYFFNPESEKNIYFADLKTLYELGEDQPRATLSLGFNRFIGSDLSLEAAASYSTLANEPNVVRLGLGIRSFVSREDWRARSAATSRFARGSYILGFSDFELGVQDDIFRGGIQFSNGYFITDRFVLGLREMASFSRRSTAENLDFRSWENELSAFGRYYLNTSGGRLVPFAELGGGFRNVNTRSDGSYRIESFRWIGEARVGLNVFVTPEMAFEFALVGRHEGRSNEDRAFQDRTRFPEEFFTDFDGMVPDRNTQLGLHVGVQFFLKQD
ncbi:MAG: hypothetical protein AAFP77_12400 [Bacteroidota bacterium]